jgi:pimeloyl-ACP methyl ester carboxylesterase
VSYVDHSAGCPGLDGPVLFLRLTPRTTEGPPMPRISTLVALGVAALTVVSGCAGGAPAPAAQPAPAADPGRYASVNGLEMYYEVHGPEGGRPLVLLHGALSGIGPDFSDLIPALAQHRRVIAVEQQAHGRTADVDRPLRTEQMAADTVALLDGLGVADADVLGYSMGAGVALAMGFSNPDLVHKLVLLTPGYDNTFAYPGMLEGLQGLQPEMLHGSPFHEYYLAEAPRPDDFPVLVEKNKDMQAHYPEYPASAVQGLAAPVLLVAGDSDIVRIQHLVEFFGLLGGNVVGDQVGLPDSQLAVLPGTTHTGLPHRPELHAIVPAFLDAPVQG